MSLRLEPSVLKRRCTETDQKHMPLPIQLGGLNLRLAAVGEITTELVHDWMWGTDPEEAYHADVLLNRNQLLGLMVCR